MSSSSSIDRIQHFETNGKPTSNYSVSAVFATGFTTLQTLPKKIVQPAPTTTSSYSRKASIDRMRNRIQTLPNTSEQKGKPTLSYSTNDRIHNRIRNTSKQNGAATAHRGSLQRRKSTLYIVVTLYVANQMIL